LENHNHNTDDLDGHQEDEYFEGQHIDELSTKIISLEPVELLSIDDGISLLVNKNEYAGATTLRPIFPSAGIGCSIDFLAKIGQAIVKMSEDLENPQAQPIEVADVDLYVLRELVLSQVVKLDKGVALGLRLKIYNLLYGDFVREDAINNSLEQLLETSDKDGKLGTALDGFKAEHEN
jgi:hypothetical protein